MNEPELKPCCGEVCPAKCGCDCHKEPEGLMEPKNWKPDDIVCLLEIPREGKVTVQFKALLPEVQLTLLGKKDDHSKEVELIERCVELTDELRRLRDIVSEQDVESIDRILGEESK